MDYWGKLTSIDLKHCDLSLMTSKNHIQDYVDRLCKLIGMKKFGETIILDFGSNKKVYGYSMVQLIETSSITAHFANQSRSIYLDIFSCADYDSADAANFSSEYFKSEEMSIHILKRK